MVVWVSDVGTARGEEEAVGSSLRRWRPTTGTECEAAEIEKHVLMALMPLPLGLASQRMAEPEAHDVRAAEESIFSPKNRNEIGTIQKSRVAVSLVFLPGQNKYLEKKNISIGFNVSKLAGALLDKTPTGSSGHGASAPSLPDVGRNRTERRRPRDGGESADQRRVLVKPPCTLPPSLLYTTLSARLYRDGEAKQQLSSHEPSRGTGWPISQPFSVIHDKPPGSAGTQKRHDSLYCICEMVEANNPVAPI